MKRALVLAVVLVLAACTSVGEGEVVEKDHEPMYVTTTMIVCGNIVCPVTQVYPESWRLWVCDGGSPDAERECEWWTVSPARYEATQIGDWVTKDPA